ncbi:MAG: two-component system, OmpR family, heavy metal sensor histidine kinase CusS [Verrucomicrobiota bacterium]|jgi:two-component system heavy metal sensor histidine kinase CusS
MFSKPTEPRSIASKLVFLFTLAAALLLFSGLGAFYLIVVRHAFEEDNGFLIDKVFALRADLGALDSPKGLLEELKVRRAGEPAAYWVRVIDSNGQVAVETPGMDEVLPSSTFPTSGSSPAIPRPKNYQTDGKLFSLVTTSGQTHGHAYLLQVAQDRSADARFTREFGALLSLVLIAGIIASAVIAITVTNRGLRPLGEMTRALKRVGPSHLNERIGSTRWPQELNPLALAFDEMLGRMEDSFKRLSQFSADLAHELRTPVANLLGESQVALTRDRTSEEYREVIESSVAEYERLSGTIENLLFLARADAAAEQTQRQHLDGKTEVEKVAAVYETVAEEQAVTIRCIGLGAVDADPVLFGRAISNLLENALRFTPRGGTIAISIKTDIGQSIITVTDSGCGIAAEHIPRVFDRFYRADLSRSSHGAGLGLAMVRSIAELHGGTARIESEVNCGTTVTLIFPNARRQHSIA